MADHKSYEDRQESAVDDFKQQLEEIRSRAEAEREEAKPDQGETEEEYRERIANVPGIFGDIDTTAGVGASGTDVVSAQNELATQAAAEVEARAAEGEEEAQELSTDEARRQADAAGQAPSAEQVDEAAPERSEDEDVGGSQEDVKNQATAQAGNTPSDSALESANEDNSKKQQEDEKKSSSRRKNNKSNDDK